MKKHAKTSSERVVLTFSSPIPKAVLLGGLTTFLGIVPLVRVARSNVEQCIGFQPLVYNFRTVLCNRLQAHRTFSSHIFSSSVSVLQLACGQG
jgi:hypothetical protein